MGTIIKSDFKAREKKKGNFKLMKIAVLSINIGNYICYWKEFYETAKLNFLPMHDRDFYVFTEHSDIDYCLNDDVHIVYQENLGWPGNTLKRFHMFIGQKEKLQEYDYIFFINANCVFLRRVGDEILPNATEKLVFVKRQPPYLNLVKEKNQPFELNQSSTAFVKDTNMDYVRGGLNGGIAKDYLAMCDVLKNNIDIDEANGIVAIWHDESHINKYYQDHPETKILGPEYLYPEGVVMPYPKIIMYKKKNNDAMRGRKRNMISELKEQTVLSIRNIVYWCLIKIGYIKYEGNTK